MFSSAVSEKLSDWKHPYGSVESARDNQKNRSPILMCGLVLFATVAVAVAAAVVWTRHGGVEKVTPKGAPPMIPVQDIGSHQLTTTTCEAQEKLVAGSDECVVCLSEQASPKIAPSKCPLGTYYDEVDTCSCVPCLENCCCPGGDVLTGCPLGSFQPATGQATCKQAVVSSLTDGFSYDEKRALFTDEDKQVSFSKTVQTSITCPSGTTGRAMAVISGMNLNAQSSKFSIQVGGEVVTQQSVSVTVTKTSGSKISGFAMSLAETCVPQDSVLNLGSVAARNVGSGPKVRIVKTSMKCDVSDAKVFAALNQIESNTQGGKLSISLKSSARESADGSMYARVEMSSTTGVVSAGAGVLSFCTSEMLGAGMIQTGLISGGAISPNEFVMKNVTLKNMECDVPQVALGLTQLDATGGLAINLELVRQSRNSFAMKFVSMGPTTVNSIEAAYLATCPMNPIKVQAAIEKSCPPPPCSNNKLALNTAATQSSEYGPNPGPAARAVDGISTSVYTQNSCTHTGLEVHPYWFADMGAEKSVCSVWIQNRVDCCSDRLQDFVIFVTNNAPSGSGAAYDPTPDEICYSMKGTFQGNSTFPCGKTGRYVGVQLRQASANYLTLCEVMVNGQ